MRHRAQRARACAPRAGGRAIPAPARPGWPRCRTTYTSSPCRDGAAGVWLRGFVPSFVAYAPFLLAKEMEQHGDPPCECHHHQSQDEPRIPVRHHHVLSGGEASSVSSLADASASPSSASTPWVAATHSTVAPSSMPSYACQVLSVSYMVADHACLRVSTLHMSS